MDNGNGTGTDLAVQGISKPVAGTMQIQQISAEYLEKAAKYAGEGLSQKQEDNLIPLVYMLHDVSPQVKKREPKYIEGAEPGDMLLTSLGRIYKGQTGFIFQPVLFRTEWVEWVPREKGGGVRGRSEELPDKAIANSDPKNPGFKKYTTPDGNDLIYTRHHYGYILDPEMGSMPALIPLTSTGHAVSKNWMTLMNSRRLPNGMKASSWFFSYRLTSILRKNPGNPDSYTWKVTEGDPVTPEQFDLGTALREAVLEGTKTAAAPEGEAEKDEIPF